MQTDAPVMGYPEFARRYDAAHAALVELGGAGSTLPGGDRLSELIKLRVSRLNGCGFCEDLHLGRLRGLGVSEGAIHAALNPGANGGLDPREALSLRWADAVAELRDATVVEALAHEMRMHFSADEMVRLTLVVGAISHWNRLAIALGFTSPKAAP